MTDESTLTMQTRRRIPQLDGLRGLCAMSVLVGHLVLVSHLLVWRGVYPGHFLTIIGSFGHLAVLIFFVLSGFVIGYTTPEQFTLKNAKQYIFRRLIRLYPIYFIAIILSFAVSEKPFNLTQFLSHLFFLQHWIVPIIDTNGPLWSLHYEFFFYLLFLAIWAWRIYVPGAICVCIVFALLSAVINFHPFKILGYFAIWLLGFWLAKNKNTLLSNKAFSLNSFWATSMLVVAFGYANIYEEIINRYGVRNLFLSSEIALPPVFCDVILSGLITSIVGACLGCKTPGYRLSFSLAILGTLPMITYGIHKGFINTINYQLAVICLAIIPLGFLFKGISINSLKYFRSLGDISYALYVIHYPIQVFIHRKIQLANQEASLFWYANLVIAILALTGAWFLECYIHPKVSKQLKIMFGLT